MCGIAGFLGLAGGDRESDQTIRRMTDTLQHRGPDDSGVWTDLRSGIALGNRRLAILDLTLEGHQPMHSSCGRYALAFNGEIYNFESLREELSALGHSFRGRSDTEVMLAAFTHWGLDAALERFNGMFAFALWDREQRALHLARDRLGEKPLYYGWTGKTLLFGSELKALKAHPRFKGEVDRDALALYLRHNYVPAPYSIYEGVYKLPPGTKMTIRNGESIAPEPVAYWSAKDAAENGVDDPFDGSEKEAVDVLENLLRDSIGLRMLADVPVGAFLSGGIDSSTVAALMQTQRAMPVKTFSIGFSESDYNEAEHAKSVARHLGTEHTELYLSPGDAMNVIPNIPDLYDEPFSDSSQIPTFLVSKLAREHVMVSLSGDGGDELFGGYKRYALGRDLWGKIGWMSPLGRAVLSRMISAVPIGLLNSGARRVLPGSGKYGRAGMAGDKLHKLTEILTSKRPEAMYHNLVSHWKDPASIVIGAMEPPTNLTDSSVLAQMPKFTQRMMYLDLISYLPDDILAKVDRASMGVSLEARVPLLDHRVVEFAFRTPLSMKIRNGQSKWLLRQVLYRYVPKELVDRPKMGFGVPVGDWLRGPLREWAKELLDERRLRDEGFFDADPIRHKWLEHLSGERNWHYHLWDVLMFQAWLERQRQIG